MARTSKKAKAVTAATVAEAATDAEIRNGVETADVAALPPTSEPEAGTSAEAETVVDAAGVAAEAVSAPQTEAETATEPEPAELPPHGTELFIPLNKLKKSPRNARKTPHTEAEIEAYAGSIAAKGILHNLVVEPELDTDGKPTGFYFVSIGEGRRLAQLLRAKRKEIKRTEAIRCRLDTENDPFEISLDENVTRAAMHPADQFEAFRELADNRGWGAEEIAARFGVTPHVVKQRMRLGAVSPKLMQVYREGGLSLEQLMAFGITDDHARQEQVYANLHYNRDASIIRRDLTANNVPATDRRAVFIGAEAYQKAGGTIIRDLFTEDRGGYFEDAALLDRLVIAELEKIARARRKDEGWKWCEAHIDFPHAHGFRRVYAHPVERSDEEEAIYAAAQEKYAALSEKWDGADELPPKVAKRLDRLEEEIARIDAARHAYDPDDIGRGGLFVVLNHDGQVRIERGFIRPEDEAPEPEPEEVADGETVIDGVRVNGDGEVIEDGFSPDPDSGEDDEEPEGDADHPISDLLTRDLTAHRTLGLRLAFGEQPDMALIAVTHALAAQTFYLGMSAHALEIRPISADLDGHAVGIEDTEAAKLLSDRHAGWAQDMPQNVADLWDFIAGLDPASVMALFAHCASLTVNALKLPWEHKHRAYETADRLATALALDMSQHWTPTVSAYLGRVTKAHILAAVREGADDEAADRLAGKKKQEMAEAAEQLLAGTGWLPPLLRTEPPAWADPAQANAEADVPETPEPAGPEAEEPVDPEVMPPETPDPDADAEPEADEPPPDLLDPDAEAPADPEEAPISPDPDAEDGGEDMDGEAFHEAAE